MGNKVALYQFAVGDFDHFDICNKSAKRYAAKIGADYIIDRKRTILVDKCMCAQKWQITELLREYDWVLYVDSDVYIRRAAPDITTIHYYPDTMYAFDENRVGGCVAKILVRSKHPEFQKMFKKDKDGRVLNPYYNAGVMLIPRSMKKLFSLKEYFETPLQEQCFLNYNIKRFSLNVQGLDIAWNGMIDLCAISHINRHHCWFIHYGGPYHPGLLQTDVKKMEELGIA